jgi:hypothetical protein
MSFGLLLIAAHVTRPVVTYVFMYLILQALFRHTSVELFDSCRGTTAVVCVFGQFTCRAIRSSETVEG